MVNNFVYESGVMMVPKLGEVASKVNDVELEQLLFDLVRIPSVNPKFRTGDEPGEIQIVEFLEKKMTDYGLEIERQEVETGGSNLIARIRGDGQKTLVFNGHLDTVTGANMPDAFSPRIRRGRLYGRGASDMKGGIAAMIAAVRAVKTSNVKLDGEIVLSLVVDEEYGGAGTKKFLEKEKPDCAIVGEPTHNEIGLAQAGYIEFNLESEGEIKHGSTLKVGDNSSAYVNATNILTRILELPSVRRMRRHLNVEMPNTVNFCPVDQRVFTSFAWMTVDYYKVNVLIGVAPGRTVAESDRIIEDMLEELEELVGRSNKDGQRNKLEYDLAVPPYKNHGFIQPRNDFVKAFEKAVDETQGSHRYGYVLSFCDGTFFYDRGIPTLTYGPGIMELGHSNNEYVDLNEVKEAARIYAQAIINILGTETF
jgi:acetylornithine deacetylase/succinyl-diaminopimelate desuccinylase-like protein